uniref:Uncharacterized protein n=1 Tax=Anopheles farauti TaxID=69004 RepID=A0A182QBF5_9DIPT
MLVLSTSDRSKSEPMLERSRSDGSRSRFGLSSSSFSLSSPNSSSRCSSEPASSSRLLNSFSVRDGTKWYSSIGGRVLVAVTKRVTCGGVSVSSPRAIGGSVAMLESSRLLSLSMCVVVARMFSVSGSVSEGVMVAVSCSNTFSMVERLDRVAALDLIVGFRVVQHIPMHRAGLVQVGVRVHLLRVVGRLRNIIRLYGRVGNRRDGGEIFQYLILGLDRALLADRHRRLRRRLVLPAARRPVQLELDGPLWVGGCGVMVACEVLTGSPSPPCCSCSSFSSLVMRFFKRFLKFPLALPGSRRDGRTRLELGWLANRFSSGSPVSSSACVAGDGVMIEAASGL